MFYSKSTGGFYDAAIHGPRKILSLDPSWVRPEVDGVPDMEALQPVVEVDNPDCKIPADAVEVTQAYRDLLGAGESSGKRIVADENGYPVLADPVPVPLSELVALAKAQVRVARVPVFSSLAGLQSQALAKGDSATALAISDLQDKLSALTNIDLSQCITQQEIDAAFVAAWQHIVSSAPVSVASAFNGVAA